MSQEQMEELFDGLEAGDRAANAREDGETVEGSGAEGECGEPPDDPVGFHAADAPWPDDHLPLTRHVEAAYLSYGMSVVTGRALPAVADGQKPVQRRVLHAMNELRLAPTAKPVKSARVVGDVIGKYHPHGDSSVYEALVRMAQAFSLRYPLVDGHGNFGSLDGDSAAAMRYTECRLTPVASLLLEELDQGTVEFRSNYDGAFEEPVIMPAKLPFVLLNGASGIAVGMATEIPPHNMGEVAAAVKLLLKKPAAQLDEVMRVLPGPDFPGGGQITATPDEIREAYATARGSIAVRARWRFEELARGEWRAIVHELPPGVSAARVMQEIDALSDPKPKTGRKDLTAEQRAAKASILGHLSAVRDESSKEQPIRLVLEPKSRTIDRDGFVAEIAARTSLSTSVTVNLVALGTDGRPKGKPLLEILREWIGFRLGVVERRIRHRLGKIASRLHILEGRREVLLKIDEVIRVIRESEDPKPALMARFRLSEAQAEDILEIRLRALARLEAIKVEKEMAALKEEQAALEQKVASEATLREAVAVEVDDAVSEFGDKRRTVIEPEVMSRKPDQQAAVIDQAVTLSVSRAGWLHVREGHGLDEKAFAYKSGDGPMAVFKTGTTETLCLLDSRGRAYSIRVSDMAAGKHGSPLSSFVELQDGAALAHALCGKGDEVFLFAGGHGYGFVACLSDLFSRQRAGKVFLKQLDGAAVLAPAPFRGAHVVALSSAGRMVIFPARDMKRLEAGKGVILQKLGTGERLAAVSVGSAKEARIEIEGGRTATVKGDRLEKCRLSRGAKGCYVVQKRAITGMAVE